MNNTVTTVIFLYYSLTALPLLPNYPDDSPAMNIKRKTLTIRRLNLTIYSTRELMHKTRNFVRRVIAKRLTIPKIATNSKEANQPLKNPK